MFETYFSDILNPEHELLRAASLIDWDGLQEAPDVYYSPLGRQGSHPPDGRHPSSETPI